MLPFGLIKQTNLWKIDKFALYSRPLQYKTSELYCPYPSPHQWLQLFRSSDLLTRVYRSTSTQPCVNECIHFLLSLNSSREISKASWMPLVAVPLHYYPGDDHWWHWPMVNACFFVFFLINMLSIGKSQWTHAIMKKIQTKGQTMPQRHSWYNTIFWLYNLMNSCVLFTLPDQWYVCEKCLEVTWINLYMSCIYMSTSLSFPWKSQPVWHSWWIQRTFWHTKPLSLLSFLFYSI